MRLRAEGLVVRSGPVTVDVPHLEARPGEVLCVLGPNGAGKSTLLLALAGLRPPERGTIHTEGEIAYLPQRPVMFSRSVLANVALPLRLRRAPRRDADERARRALGEFAVAHLADRPAWGLSGGEARRVALARAIVTRPDVLLLDEPFGGLDAPTRARLLKDAMGTIRDSRAVVLVTHDREEAVALGDRVLVLVEGRVEQEGPVEEVFGRPSTETVAELVGAENVLFGRVAGEEREVLRVDVLGVRLEAVGDAAAGDDVVLTIRPEVVVLYPAGEGTQASARNRLDATVTSLERRPHLVRVGLEVGRLRLVAAVAPTTVEDMALSPGARVSAGVKATSVHAIRRASSRQSPA